MKEELQPILDAIIKSKEFSKAIKYLESVEGGYKGSFKEYYTDSLLEQEFVDKVSRFFKSKSKIRDFIDKIPEFSSWDQQVEMFCRNLYYLGYKIKLDQYGLKGLTKLFEGWLDTYAKEDGTISAMDDHKDIADAVKKYWKREGLEDHERDSLSQLFLKKATRKEIIQWIWMMRVFKNPNITDHILFNGIEMMRTDWNNMVDSWFYKVKVEYKIDITKEQMMSLWMQDDQAITKLIHSKHPGVKIKEPFTY